MSELSRAETTSRIAELERPQEIGSLLEVGADGEDLVDQILHANNPVLAKICLDESVVSESNALLVNLAITALIDKLSDCLEVGVSVSNPRLDNLQHLESSLCQTDKDTVVDLKETKELENLARLRRDFVDTVLVRRFLRGRRTIRTL